MPFVPVTDTVMVEWRCTRNSQQVENRVMVDMLAAPVRSEMEDLATVCWNWWENVHSQHLSATVALREVVVTDISQVDGEQVTYAPDTTTAGAINLQCLPNEVAFCVSLRSGFRGRSARGRWYTLSVAPSQMANDNELTSGAVSAFVSDLNELRNVIQTAGKNLVIVSYRHNKAPRVGGPVKYTVQSATAVDATVDSMKRRKPGVGS